MGTSKCSVVLWVSVLKRDPHAPLHELKLFPGYNATGSKEVLFSALRGHNGVWYRD
jgi:hypothetical protein